MGSVMGPRPAYVPQNGSFPSESSAQGNTATSDYASRTGRSQSSGNLTDHQAPTPRPVRTPSMPPGSYAQFDNRPAMYDRPTRPSSSSSNGSTTMTRDSVEARMRSPASSRTSFESWESHRRVEYGWQRPAPIKQYRRKAQPGEQLAALPDEVLDLILGELRRSHLSAGSFTCATCMMRDLCSVALGSRRLLKVARSALYENIQLVGNDSHIQKKRYKINHGSRMVLLRRTLRSNPGIAATVHSLKAPIQPQGMPIDQYLNLVASVIMACPNFEQLVGPHQNYDHSFNRLFHALSTRARLKTITWVVEASAQQRRARPNMDEEQGELHPQQSTAFLELNMNWNCLTTVLIHCLPGATLTPVSLVSTALSTMPALQHLHLSQLPLTAFDDTDLLSLASLKTLSLTDMPGITSAGISSFATRQSSQSLRSLTLQRINLDSIAALTRIFLNLVSLESFSLVQSTTPVLPPDEMIWLFPYLGSTSLRKLHWDITSQTTRANTADWILAKSIGANGFPALRVLRAPNDPEGIFQNLCSPIERIEMASDRYVGRGLVSNIPNARPTAPRTSSNPGKSPKALQFPGFDEPKKSSSLHHARLVAQSRLEAARSNPRFTVNVIEEDGSILESYGLAGFIGETRSQIQYCLTPDPGATDENGGLVRITDVLNDGGEDLADREGCTGRWNNYGDDTMDRKDKERWWHAERARWTEVTLS